MERKTGTISRGIRCPIIREGDDIASIVVDSVIEASEAEGFALRNRDVVAVTESVVARAQGHYASVDAIAADVKEVNFMLDNNKLSINDLNYIRDNLESLNNKLEYIESLNKTLK